MRILFDTNILLNDFFWRNPEFGRNRISDPSNLARVELYRHTVHQCLEKLSQNPNTRPVVPSYIIPRLTSILADVFVPDYLIAQEISWQLNNLELVPFGLEEIEEAMVLWKNWNSSYPLDENRPGLEEMMLQRAAELGKCEFILSSNTKGRTHLGSVKIIKPETVLSEII